jgi:hypothetical protein
MLIAQNFFLGDPTDNNNYKEKEKDIGLEDSNEQSCEIKDKEIRLENETKDETDKENSSGFFQSIFGCLLCLGNKK